jgi:hypothetical protein
MFIDLHAKNMALLYKMFIILDLLNNRAKI